MERIRGIFDVPGNIREKFWEQLLASNWKMMFIVSIFAAAAQIVNICHVLFFSSRKLETLNNRIYFTFYCVFLLLNLLFLFLRIAEKNKISRNREKVYQGLYGMAWILWNILLNYYDIIGSKGRNANISVMVTCLLGCAIIIQSVPLYAVCVYGGSAVFFSIAVYPVIQLGGVINVMAAGVMAVIVSWARFRYSIKDLQTQDTIQKMNEKLSAEQEQLNLSLQKFQFVVDEMDNILFEWDMEKQTITFYGKWQDKMDCDGRVTDALEWFENSACLEEQEKQEILRGIRRAAHEQEIYESEIRIFDRDRNPEWYLLRLLFQYKKDREVKSGIGFLTNIQRQKWEMALLKNEMNRDYLTGVLSRKGIQDYAQAQLSQCGKDENIAMVIVDLDDFKQINDCYGHPFGDEVLKETAAVLTGVFGESGEVGRIGGDEFMAVMSHVSCVDMLEEKIQQLEEKNVTVRTEEGEITVQFSLGGALAGRGGNYHALYQRADKALYHTKEMKKRNLKKE